MKQFEVEGHAPSLVPEGKEWKLVWADEFDGTELDRTKWDYRLSMMGKRHITWTDDGVTLDGNSNAVFRIFEKDGEICSSQLQTGYNYMDAEVDPQGYHFDGGLTWPIGKLKKSKFLKQYGYFECRCKLQKMEGWWSAFWLQSPTIGCDLDPGIAGIENDIMESLHPGEIIGQTNHYGGYGDDHQRIRANEGAKGFSLDEYHTFGMLWEKTGYTFYIDGKESGHIDGPVSHRPQFILLSAEVNGYRKPPYTATEEAKAAAKAGDVFLVDHIRVFDPAE